MRLLTLFSYTSTVTVVAPDNDKQPEDTSELTTPSHTVQPNVLGSPNLNTGNTSSTSDALPSISETQPGSEFPVVTARVRSFSVLRLFRSAPKGKVVATHSQHHVRKSNSRADKEAKRSAVAVRSLIVGPVDPSVKMTPATARSQMSKVKSQLVQPKSAKRVIQHLRYLPSSEGTSLPSSSQISHPIHAVCLEHTEAEEDRIHFSKLSCNNASFEHTAIPAIISAPIDNLSMLFSEMNIVDLVNSPTFGLGQPGDGKGILAGSVPTPETVLQGVKQITPELMALGYATGKAIIPDHTGIYPPTDRMSVLTYWWGLELVLPPPTIQYLDNVQSITNAVVNFLSALALINNGVREILPFVRYIAQFVEFEFDAIRKQDEGEGVVCAATWVMPAAMVPRPWDFAPPPPNKGPVEKIIPVIPSSTVPKSTPSTLSGSILDTVTTGSKLSS